MGGCNGCYLFCLVTYRARKHKLIINIIRRGIQKNSGGGFSHSGRRSVNLSSRALGLVRSATAATYSQSRLGCRSPHSILLMDWRLEPRVLASWSSVKPASSRAVRNRAPALPSGAMGKDGLPRLRVGPSGWGRSGVANGRSGPSGAVLGPFWVGMLICPSVRGRRLAYRPWHRRQASPKTQTGVDG